jgi:hypothetical protein
MSGHGPRSFGSILRLDGSAPSVSAEIREIVNFMNFTLEEWGAR